MAPSMDEQTVVAREDGRLIAVAAGTGRRRVIAEGPDGMRRTCETTYPDELLRRLVELRGLAWVCDEIARDEDPDYLERALRVAVLGHVPADELAGARMLDFGCGAGASTLILGRMLPRTEVVGIELQEHLLDVARERARHHGLDNVAFLPSPHADRLPADLGRFRFVNLGAVWEHMLPGERARVVPDLWRTLDEGGTLFISDTPHRWTPWEAHTTGLPLLNYLPDGLALRAARHLSRRVAADASWPDLLRKGIRGGSRREIARTLRATGDGRPVELPPRPEVGRTAADAWYASGPPTSARRAARAVFRAMQAVTGVRIAPTLVLAIRKSSGGGTGVRPGA
jgi:2-polyprenyl-3-methyl-5-hydroxy-6-metoxy-1,4-benzoquinol methylase